MDRINSLKKEFFEIISFDSKYSLFTFVSILVVLAIVPITFLESAPNLSICSRILKDYCYSVGITRGVSALLKGNLVTALSYNWLSIPVLIIMLVIILVDFKKKFRR